MAIPYESATSGAAARDETVRLLRGIGADNIGFMDRFSDNSLVLGFTLRGTGYKLEASAKGWAAWWLRKNPHTSRHRSSREEHQQKAMAQGLIAINSILRDYCKGMVAAIECGMVEPEQAMLGHMLLANGHPVIKHIAEQKLLTALGPWEGKK